MGAGATIGLYDASVVATQREQLESLSILARGYSDTLDEVYEDAYRALDDCHVIIGDAVDAGAEMAAAYEDSRRAVDDFFTPGLFQAGDADFLYFSLSLADEQRYGADSLIEAIRFTDSDCFSF